MTQPSSTQIILSSTFTADYVVPALTYWLDRLEIQSSVRVAPFDQLFQMLLSEHSEFGQNSEGVNIALVRVSDWLSGASVGNDSGIAQEFVEAASNGAGVAGTTLLVMFCPSDPLPGNQQQCVEMEESITAGLSQATGVQVIGSNTLQQDHAGLTIHNAEGDRLAAAPFEPAFFSTIGTRLARTIYGSMVPTHKVLVLDCDDTLWGGLCGELGHNGVEIKPAHRLLQQFAVDQAKQGVLICLASRNNEKDVLAVFANNPDMLLKQDHLAAWQINWGMKSASLAALAADLGLGLDSFVFIDDDPVQLTEVQSVHPQVLALRAPAADTEMARLLRNVWALDNHGNTRESADRGAAYRDHAARETLRTSSPTLQQFLESLELDIAVEKLTETGILRAVELSQRTNQFNLTGARFTEADIRRLMSEPSTQAFTVAVTDRFGDYGTVGLMLCRPVAQGLEVFGFYLSCRALGRGVEHHMLRHLGQHATENNLQNVRLTCISTDRNQPAQEFVRALSDAYGQDQTWTMEAADAAVVQPEYDRPNRDSGPPAAVSVTVTGTGTGTEGNVVQALADAASHLSDPQAVHRAVHELDGKANEVAAATEEDPVLALLRQQFSQLLGIDEIDDDIGFFELGGHSLQAVQVLVAASNAYEIELDPTLLFTTNFSIVELQDEINHLTAAKGSYEGVGGLLDQLSQMTD